jgi:phosphatidylserine/phosphatidylglycerophosphate/cardiolipin synthase-like enzyme
MRLLSRWKRLSVGFAVLLCLGAVASALASASVAHHAAGHRVPPPRDRPAASAATPYLDAVARTLRERSPGTKGKVWWVSDENRLPSDWLLQTPDCWGRSDCGKPPPGGRRVVARMRDMIAGAHKSVDIAELYDDTATGYPDGEYLDAIIDGLKEGHRIHPGEVPVVRLLLGIFPSRVYYPERFAQVLQERVGNWVKVQSGVMQSTPTSWNHAKVWDVDGRDAIVGGMNYWSRDYLNTQHPVNDVSMEVIGPAATDVAHFTNLLWSWTCEHQGFSVAVYRLHVSSCVKDIPVATAPVEPSGIPIMVVGKLGMGIPVPGEAGRESTPFTPPPIQGNRCPAGTIKPDEVNDSRAYEYRNPGETALRALVASAKHSIFISQQDLLSCLPVYRYVNTEDLFDTRLFAELAAKVVERVPIKIVLSGGNVEHYRNCCEPKDVASVLALSIVAKYKMPAQQAVDAVCRDVGLATIRNDSEATWPGGDKFRNHAKVVEVDDEAFYIGSGNLYPSRLQELGMIVDNREAAAHLKSAYLDPLWHWSRADAVIDPETKKCG